MKRCKFATKLPIKQNFMNRTLYFSFACLLSIAGCSETDFESSRSEQIKDNAENILGIIDPKQDWNLVTNANVTITADAPLYDVEKVQILTESPFFLSTKPTVLAEAKVAKGETVTLCYDAPSVYSRVFAACVNSKGVYYAKGMDVTESKVSFKGGISNGAASRAVSRAESGNWPDYTKMKLELKNTKQSFNSKRTIRANDAAASGNALQKSWVNDNNIAVWENANWEDDRLWGDYRGSGKTDDLGVDIGGGWYFVNNTVCRFVDDMDEEEKTTLKDFYSENLGVKKTGNAMQDNMEKIRNGSIFNTTNNHLVSNGTDPITVIPVQMTTTDRKSLHIYYYYYNPASVPAGMSEVDYLKSIPKFKAIQLGHTIYQWKNKGYQREDFFKIHEYMLPYYGEPETFFPERTSTSSFCVSTPATGGKLYRIRNGKLLDGSYYYMTFINTGNADVDKLATKYSDDDINIANQLWQVFTTSDGGKLLYNIGSKYFLVWDGDWGTTYSTDQNTVKGKGFIFNEADGITQIVRSNNSQKGLGTDLGVKSNKGVYSDKGTGNGDNFNWIFEEYTGTSAKAIAEYTFKKYPEEVTAKSNVIPAGYRVGFMVRKIKNDSNNDTGIKEVNNGCCYGDGRLNTQINQFGAFNTAARDYSMKTDDPRVAFFQANGKTYITFEDGSDCNFCDIILEVGGYDKSILTEAPNGTEEKSSGIETDNLYDECETENITYTLCFEDRPVEADYDLNDVVLCCKRSSDDEGCVELTLVASGADDDVWIRNIPGEFKRGTALDSKEVHGLFGVEKDESGHRFVNTVKGAAKVATVTGVYELPADMTIPQFLSQIYIENVSTNSKIEVAKQGLAPCGVIIPDVFNYPIEKVKITNPYLLFRNWANKASEPEFKTWYMNEENGTTIKMSDIIH